MKCCSLALLRSVDKRFLQFVTVVIKFFQDFVLSLHKVWKDFVFFFLIVLQTFCNPWFGEKFQFLFVKFFDWCNKICFHFIWLKSDINVLLSDFFHPFLRILDFVTEIFEKKSGKKINCESWSENVVVTLPDSVSSKEVTFEKIISM